MMKDYANIYLDWFFPEMSSSCLFSTMHQTVKVIRTFSSPPQTLLQLHLGSIRRAYPKKSIPEYANLRGELFGQEHVDVVGGGRQHYTSTQRLKSRSWMLVSLKVKVTQSWPTLCGPMVYTVHGILQAKILEWVAVVPFFKGSSQPRDRTQVSHTASYALPAEPPGKSMSFRHAKSTSTHLEKKNLYNRSICLVCHKSVKVQKCSRIILSSRVTKASGWCKILKTKWCLSLSPPSWSFLLRTTSLSPIQSPPSPGTE